MRGGAQSHLMRCADGHYYVVKFQNNPQHTRVLVNDWLGTRLGEMIGLPVPVPAIVDVHPWLVEHTPDLRMELCGRRTMFTAGLSFGSRYVISPLEGQVYDYLPEAMIPRLRNVRDFAGILALDKWTCNANGRQALFHRKGREKRYSAAFVDQGFCFNAGEWRFLDAPLRGVYARNLVYSGITGWESFEPWLTRIEEIDPDRIWSLAEAVPPEWYEGDVEILERLMEKLIERRTQVRPLITSFRDSSRQPFPNWNRASSAPAGRRFPAPDWTDNVQGGIQ